MLNQSLFYDYLNNVCQNVSFKRAHISIKKELYNHLEDQYDCHIDQGLSENEAYEKTIQEMGDADYVGKEINKAYKATPDWIMLLFTFSLMLIGCIVFYSSSDGQIIQAGHTAKYTAYLVVGISIIFLLYFFDYTRLARYAYFLYFFGIFLSILAVVLGQKITLFSHTDFISAIFLLVGFSSVIYNFKNNNSPYYIKILLSYLPVVIGFINMTDPIIIIILLSNTILLIMATFHNKGETNKKIKILIPAVFSSSLIISFIIKYAMQYTKNLLHRLRMFLRRA